MYELVQTIESGQNPNKLTGKIENNTLDFECNGKCMVTSDNLA